MNTSSKSSRQISLERAEVLKSRIDPYLNAKLNIPTGLEKDKAIQERQSKIKAALGATEADWNDWKWQIKNRISDSDTLEKFISLTPKQKQDIDAVAKKYRWAISPYFLSLIEPDGDHFKDPIYLQSVPTGLELKEGIGSADPMAEEFTNPATCITRRYPDRLIINVTNQCGMYCRHCQRRRNIGEIDKPQTRENLQQAIDYINNTPEIRDVLVTGGDPFTLSDELLDWLLYELDKIPHLEFKRIAPECRLRCPKG